MERFTLHIQAGMTHLILTVMDCFHLAAGPRGPVLQCGQKLDRSHGAIV